MTTVIHPMLEKSARAIARRGNSHRSDEEWQLWLEEAKAAIEALLELEPKFLSEVTIQGAVPERMDDFHAAIEIILGNRS